MDVHAFEISISEQFPSLSDELEAETHAGLRIELFARHTRAAITARDRDALSRLFTFVDQCLHEADPTLRRGILCHYLTHLHFAGIPPEESRALQQLMPENLHREWIEMNAIINQVEQAEQGGHQ